MEELVKYKWINHDKIVISQLANFWKQELFTDCTILCGGKKFMVHRLVLASCSEYFKEVFDNAQCCHPIIIMNDISCEDLEILLNYIYQVNLVIPQRKLTAIVEEGQALKIRGFDGHKPLISCTSSNAKSDTSENFILLQKSISPVHASTKLDDIHSDISMKRKVPKEWGSPKKLRKVDDSACGTKVEISKTLIQEEDRLLPRSSEAIDLGNIFETSDENEGQNEDEERNIESIFNDVKPDSSIFPDSISLELLNQKHDEKIVKEEVEVLPFPVEESDSHDSLPTISQSTMESSPSSKATTQVGYKIEERNLMPEFDDEGAMSLKRETAMFPKYGQQYGTLSTSYVLPYINPQSKLGMALKNKEELSKALKSQFISKIFDSFARKKVYYLGKQNGEVVNAILSNYPHLGMNLPYNSAKQMWSKILYAKFYNAKKRDCSDEELKYVQEQKKKRSQSSADLEKQYGIPNYKPTGSFDDDDKAILDSHKAWMCNEYRKTERNNKSISTRMDLTFRSRREMLFKERSTRLSSVEILDEYPCLRLENQVVLEAERLFGFDNFSHYTHIIGDFADVVATSFANSKNKYKVLLDGLFSAANSQNDEAFTQYKLVGICSALLGENPNQVIGKEVNEVCSPFLKVMEDTSVSLLVDRVTYIQSISPRKAVFLWVTSFLIFHIEVPKNLNKTYDFLQYLVFGVPQTPNLSTQAQMKLFSMYDEVKNKLNILN